MIRELRETDAAGVAQVIRETIPNWVTSERGVLHRLRNTPERAQRRDWAAEADGMLVGWGSCARTIGSERDDVAWVAVFVRPGWRGRGLGAALYESAAVHTGVLGARRLLAECADEPAARAFAEGRGFRHTMTRRLSRLDPRTVNGSVDALRPAKEAEGFTLAPFAAFADRPDLIHAVDAEASLDEPADEPTVEVRLDEWLARTWAAPDLDRERSFAVVHDGRPVAIAELIVDLAGGRAMNGFTGTLRAYRRRGLARLAKLASIEWAAGHGITSIVTENDESNASMLAINVGLGYQPFAAWLAYVRDAA
ncbi:MAG: GNAT family N-acetyltransferase [Gaiellaceae bacterium]